MNEPKHYHLRIFMDPEIVNLKALRMQADQSQISFDQVVTDALSRWDESLDQPGMELLDRMISIAVDEDFERTLELSFRMSRLAEQIRQAVYLRIGDLITNSMRNSDRCRLLLKKVYDDALVLTVEIQAGDSDERDCAAAI